MNVIKAKPLQAVLLSLEMVAIAAGNWTIGSETCVVDKMPDDPNAARSRLTKRLLTTSSWAGLEPASGDSGEIFARTETPAVAVLAISSSSDDSFDSSS